VSSSSRSTAARERAELADLLDELGPDAPTCCEGWQTAHLAAHLAVRDRRWDALPGYGAEGLPFGSPLSRWSHRLEDRLRSGTPYGEVVALVRAGAPAWSPFAWPWVGDAINLAELAIHHEDVRRAQPGWEPRPLTHEQQDAFWPSVLFYGRLAAGRRPGSVLLRRSDATRVQKRFGSAEPCRTVEGEPLELLLWAGGREQVARVEVGEVEIG
jgi:uncharacterized protein (TIGR03085 family)